MPLVINAAIIEDRRLLVLKKKESWILPGGKAEPSESYSSCIDRELGEELSGLRVKILKFYREFSGISPHTKSQITSRVYFAVREHVQRDIVPSAEITGFDWMSYDSAAKFNLSDITRDIADRLHRDNYL